MMRDHNLIDIKSATKCLMYSDTQETNCKKIKNILPKILSRKVKLLRPSVPNFDFETVRHQKKAKQSTRRQAYLFFDEKKQRSKTYTWIRLMVYQLVRQTLHQAPNMVYQLVCQQLNQNTLVHCQRVEQSASQNNNNNNNHYNRVESTK